MTIYKMLKTLSFALWTGLSLASPALAAGTIPLAMAQQIDVNGQPLAGCILNFYVAGTVASPQNSYSDFGLSLNPNNVLTCDQSGRIPMFWLADGLIHVRLTDTAGTPIIDTTMQVLGPSSGGGGGGGTVDPTAIISTGDLKVKYGTGPLTGFARLNGLTIGNASSGATERANADTQALFIYAYGVDPNLVVSGGRTGNALNDYNANKQLTLPDWRGRVLAALDDMGNSAAGRLTSTYFGAVTGANGTTLGAAGGFETHTQSVLEMPAHNHAIPQINADASGPIGNLSYFLQSAHTGNPTGASNFFQNSGSVANTGGGLPFTVVQPTMLATFYIKL